jgi:beta-mannosidase
MFSLGATYVTERAIAATITKQGTEALVKKAAEADMNTLAVYSYTVSPSEYFYELCDRYGILVWQDIPVPIITSNVAGAFAAGLSDAIKSLISRAASHTSVALMYLSVVSDGRASVTKESLAEFREIMKRLLEPVLEKYAPTVPFYFDPTVLYAADERYLSKSREGFAPSVLASMPDMATLSQIAVEDTNILSPSVEDTVKTKGAIESMLLCTASMLKFPYGRDEVAYACSYAPAYKIARSIKRARLDPMHTMSAVFRQLNDSEALISGSFIDAGGREKALCYLSSDAFAPVPVSAEVRDGKLTVGISNNTKKQYSGRLTYALYDTYGKCHAEKMKTVDLAPCSAHPNAVEDDYTRIVAGEPELYYVIYQLADYNGVRATGSELLVEPKRFAFIDPGINTEVSGSGRRFTVKLTAKKYARAVFVYLEGVDALADKNYVSVIPGTPEMVTLELNEVKTLLEVKDKLRVISIYNIGG